MKSNARQSWEIIKDFIEKNEDQFMEHMEGETDIEPSDYVTLLKQVDEEV